MNKHNAELKKVTKLKYGKQFLTDRNNLIIECKLKLNNFNKLEVADHAYLEKVIDLFAEYIKDFNIKVTDIE